MLHSLKTIMTRRVRTRFAPSPTGPLHIGGVRTALYSYLFAKKHGGDFLLRIEDTDTARTVTGSEDIINQSLQWCGITPDEGVMQGGAYGPYKQSERKDIYYKHAHQLVENGKAYFAFDTDEEIATWREQTAKENNSVSASYGFKTRMNLKNSLSLSSEEVKKLMDEKVPYVIRLLVNAEDTITFEDIVRGQVTFQSEQIDDRVLLKSDGMPTYHLANVVDDYLMKITHVMRGEEWLASTPHHVLLYRAFGWENEMPVFAHLPLFLKPDGKGKLSKRDGDRLGFPVFAIDWKNPDTGEISSGYRERGFEPEAFINFIALLGWNDGTEQELFSKEELIEKFSIERVHKAGAKFNYEKGIWFNQQYLRNLTNEEFIAKCKPILLGQYPDLSQEFIDNYCVLFQDRIDFVSQISEVGKYIIEDIETFDMASFKKKWKPETQPFIDRFIEFISNYELTTAASLDEFIKMTLVDMEMSMGNVMPILRILLTGIMQGPSVSDTIILLGKDRTIERLNKIKELSTSII